MQLTDLESMMVQLCRDKCKENPRANPLVFLGDMTIDISENKVVPYTSIGNQDSDDTEENPEN